MKPSSLDIRPIFPAWLIWLVRVLALAAAALCGYIAWGSLQAEPLAGCSPTGATDCHEILATRWSVWMGLPVAVIGASCYGSIFAVSWFVNLRLGGIQRAAVWLLTLLLLMAAGAAVWFLGVQTFYLGAFCPLCVSVHAMGLVIAGLVFGGLATAGRRGVDPQSHVLHMRGALAASGGQARQTSAATAIHQSFFVLPTALAAVGLAIFIGGQFLLPSNLPARLGATAEGEEELPADPLLAAEQPAERSYAELAAADSASEETFDMAATGSFSEPTSQAAGSGSSPRDAASDDLMFPPRFPEADASGSADADTNSAGSLLAEQEITAFLPAPDQHRTVSFLGGDLKIDLAEHAVIGSRDAPHVILELFDYTCQHCRRMQPLLQRAEQRYRGQVAIVLMPVPLDGACNPNISSTHLEHRGACEIAKLSLALAMMDEAEFRDMHYWLMEDESRRPMLDTALSRAFDRVDVQKFRAIRNSSALEARLSQYVQLAVDLEKRAPNNRLGLPVMVIGNEVITGAQDSVQAVYDAWERNLGISPTAL